MQPTSTVDSAGTASLSGVPVSATKRVFRFIAATLVWLAGNLVLWLVLVLFRFSVLRNAPILWPLFIVVFANFYLIPAAAKVGSRWSGHR